MAQPKSEPQMGSVANILAVFSEATPRQLADGLRWYDAFRADAIEAAQEAGVEVKSLADLMMVCGVAAALSPQRAPAVNLLLLRRFLADDRQPGQKAFHTPRQDRKARAIRDGQDPVAALPGPKEQAFYRAIMGEDDMITIDGHAYCVWLGERVTTNRVRVPGAGTKARVQCHRDYQKAARLLGVPAREVQAVCWVVWRDKHQDDFTRNSRNFGWKKTTIK